MDTRTLTSILILAALTPAAHSAKLRVPQQYGTVQAAIDAAAPGDVVWIDAGIYEGPFLVDQKTGIRIQGQGKRTILTGGPDEDALEIRSSEEIEVRSLSLLSDDFRGMRVRFSDQVRIRRVRIEGARVGILFERCREVQVRNCRMDGLDYGGLVLNDCSDVLIRNNWIRGGSVGIQDSSSNATIRGNRIEEVVHGIRLSGVPDSGSVETLIDGNDIRCDLSLSQYARGIHSQSYAGTAPIEVTGNQFRGAWVNLNLDTAGSVARDNRVSGGSHGFDIYRDDCVVTGNRLKNLTGHGIRFPSTVSAGSVARNNRVKNAHNAFQLESSGVLLVRNRTTGSRNFGLYDNTGMNTYRNNRFDSVFPN